MMEDLRQSKGWAKYLATQGWKIEKSPTISDRRKETRPKVATDYELRTFVRKIPALGSVVKIQRPKIIPPVEEIDKLAKAHDALCVKLEPLPTPTPSGRGVKAIDYKILTAQGFSPDPNPSLSTKTVAVDLIPSLREIFASFPADGGRTRRSIKDAQERGVKTVVINGAEPGFSDYLQKFHQLLSQTGRRQRFFTASFGQLKAKADSFGKEALLFLTRTKSEENKLLAGAFVLAHSEVAHYHHAASSPEGQKLHAPYLLMWEIIKETKKQGFKILDLGGIYDPRYRRNTSQWQSFSVFKKKFGGIETEYPAPLIKYYHPLFEILTRVGAGI